MYDFAHTAAANDTFWGLIRDHLGYGPDHLTRDNDPWDIWQSPDLLFAQTCGLPFRARLYDQVQLVGTPDYGIDGCPAGYYNSVIVVHDTSPVRDINALVGMRLAYNDPLSQSGWSAPNAHMNAAGVPFKVGPCTGGHQASAQVVANGDADFAALDAVTWRMLATDDPKTTQQLRVIGTTEPTPALPFITSPHHDAIAVAKAVDQAIDALPAKAREILGLKGLVQLPQSVYLEMPIPSVP